jgi:hypothetical protein
MALRIYVQLRVFPGRGILFRLAVVRAWAWAWAKSRVFARPENHRKEGNVQGAREKGMSRGGMSAISPSSRFA